MSDRPAAPPPPVVGGGAGAPRAGRGAEPPPRPRASGRRWLVVVALVAVVVVVAAVLVLVTRGGDDARPEAEAGTATVLVGGGDEVLSDGLTGRDAALARVYGFGVGPDGTVAVSVAQDPPEDDFSLWVLDPDQGDLREVRDTERDDPVLSAGDPVVDGDSLLLPGISEDSLADRVPAASGPVESGIGPAEPTAGVDQFVYGSLADGQDGSLWRTYHFPPLVRHHVDGDTDTVDLREEGCRNAEPHGVAVLPDGAALVADQGCAQLWVVSPQGDVASLGALPDCPDGDGTMVPTDVAIVGEQLLVSDLRCSLVWTGALDGTDLTPLLGATGLPPGTSATDAEEAPLDQVRLQAPMGVEVDGEGRVYVLSGSLDSSKITVAEAARIWVSAPGLVG